MEAQIHIYDKKGKHVATEATSFGSVRQVTLATVLRRVANCAHRFVEGDYKDEWGQIQIEIKKEAS